MSSILFDNTINQNYILPNNSKQRAPAIIYLYVCMYVLSMYVCMHVYSENSNTIISYNVSIRVLSVTLAVFTTYLMETYDYFSNKNTINYCLQYL
jgi:hypothetical protein